MCFLLVAFYSCDTEQSIEEAQQFNQDELQESAYVIAQQFEFIELIIRCFGEDYVWWDVADLADGECYWTFSDEGGDSEYVCPENPNGVGGFETVLHILEGFPVSPINAPFTSNERCWEVLTCDYYNTTCILCLNETVNSCCN